MGDDIVLGLVVKPHGLNGSIKVRSYAESLESFTDSKRLFILDQEGKRREVTVLKAVGMGKYLTLTLEGIDTREAAEALAGSKVVLKREDLPDVQEDEFYWHDLLGIAVYDSTGKYYGVVTSILPTGANDVFVVEGKTGEEILIPGTFEAIIEINVPEKKMIIEPQFGPVFHDTN